MYNQQREEAEMGKKSLSEEVIMLRTEVEALQRELFTVTEKYDESLQRYNDRRNRTRTKLQKARWDAQLCYFYAWGGEIDLHGWGD